MTVKKGAKILFLILMLVVLLVIMIIVYGTFNPPYLSQFKTKSEIYDHVTDVLPIEETTIDRLQNVITTQRFGFLDCAYFSEKNIVLNEPQLNGRISCQGQKQFFSSWFYLISFYTIDGLLDSVVVDDIYLGL